MMKFLLGFLTCYSLVVTMWFCYIYWCPSFRKAHQFQLYLVTPATIHGIDDFRGYMQNRLEEEKDGF